MKIRNIAIIAHVDHGKTTLVDGLLKQSHTFRENEAYMSQDLILDSNVQERERGITILAKNTSVFYKGTKINIIDTPGHADFSGEVERTLYMAEGALLLIDAQEGTMPQTKFVLRKALELGLKVIVLINKIDKKDAHIENTLNKVNDLFIELAEHDHHLDFPILYAVGRLGKSWESLPEDFNAPANLTPIFDAVLKYVPEPQVEPDKPFQMLVTSLDWDSYQGKYALGKVVKGKVTPNQKVFLVKSDGTVQSTKIDKIFLTSGLNKVETQIIETGDIVSITGLDQADIGDTISEISNPEDLATIKIGEPTISVSVAANTSPFSGTEGTFVTSRQVLKRIQDELQTNVAMKFKIDESGQYILSGRGELHLCVFLENLSREGFEIEIGKPKVITKEVDGQVQEPIEEYTVDTPPQYADAIIAEFSKRMGLLLAQENTSNTNTRLTFEISTRASLGLRSLLLTLSKGTAVSGSVFMKYKKVSSALKKRRRGALIAAQAGKATAYGMKNVQERAILFIDPGTPVYAGMVVGLNSRDEDLEVNVCKEKHLTNMRSKGEDGIMLDSPLKMSLEQCFGFIDDDELLEITPKNIRVRKKILDSLKRKRASH